MVNIHEFVHPLLLSPCTERWSLKADTLDKSPVHRADIERQTTIHTDIHTYGQSRMNLTPDTVNGEYACRSSKCYYNELMIILIIIILLWLKTAVGPVVDVENNTQYYLLTLLVSPSDSQRQQASLSCYILNTIALTLEEKKTADTGFHCFIALSTVVSLILCLLTPMALLTQVCMQV